MDNKMFCFIICANNELFLEECLHYIDNLIVPEGYKKDVMVIREADNILSAYNYAIHNYSAKYKIYLHQDTFILNKNILNETLDLFTNNSKIGMIGVIGCYRMPDSGVWWEGRIGYGDAYQDNIINTRRTQGNTIKGTYQEVQIIDGMIMITQYDIAWRDDILKGWHYYDASQCLEFYRAGYIVVIPVQAEPWCLHDGNIGEIISDDDDYNISKRVFLQEYGEEIGNK